MRKQPPKQAAHQGSHRIVEALFRPMAFFDG
jgi:hypothetical protein